MLPNDGAVYRVYDGDFVADAIFAPLAVRQVVSATEANQQRVTNDTLLNVAEAYFAILRAPSYRQSPGNARSELPVRYLR